MLRKYGTETSQQVTGVEPTPEAEEIRTTAARKQEWDAEDEQGLQDEAGE
jgi:hypothetical protein